MYNYYLRVNVYLVKKKKNNTMFSKIKCKQQFGLGKKKKFHYKIFWYIIIENSKTNIIYSYLLYTFYAQCFTRLLNQIVFAAK